MKKNNDFDISSLIPLKYLCLFIAFLFFTLSSFNSFSQCTILPNAVQGISYTYIQNGGTDASGVAYNPNLNIYYACIAGNSAFPFETFSATGVSLFQTSTGFDYRGLWWNPNTNQVEGTGYSNFGLWTSNLDGSGNALNTGTLIYGGQNQPDAQSCGDYDCAADEMVFYFNDSISRYSRSNGTFIGSYPLTGMPVPVGDIDWTSVIYTGCLGNEIGIEDWSAKSILLFNKATGAYSGTSFLPASAATNNGFQFSYANNLAWLYDVNTRTWTSYSIFSGQPTGGGSIVNLGNDTTLCFGNTLLLDAGNAGANFLWQDGSTNQTFNVSQTGAYNVAVSNGGCFVSHDTINITISAVGNSLFSLGNDSVMCAGQTLTLNANTAGATYLWQDASTNFSFTVSSAGTYWVLLTSGPCSNSDTINISYVNPPTVFIGNDTTLCPGQTLLVDATTANSNYVWQDNSTASSLTISTAGIYWVDVTAGSCSAVRDSIAVNFINSSSVNLGNDTSLCPGETVLLNATQPGASYSWQDGSTDSTFNVTASGNYFVNVTISICNAADTISVIYYSLPVVNLGVDTIKCPDVELVLNAQNSASTYLWHNSTVSSGFQFTDPSISITDSATYSVDVTNVCATVSDTIHIGFKICDCHIFIPTAFTPNGDNMNDVFQPKFVCDFINYDFRIFNRWGELIFSSTDQTAGWDGTYHGLKENTGVYIWMLNYKYNDGDVGTEAQLKGDVTLLK